MQKCIVICECKPCREFINISRCGVVCSGNELCLWLRRHALRAMTEEGQRWKKISWKQNTLKYFCLSTYQTHHLWTLHSLTGVPPEWIVLNVYLTFKIAMQIFHQSSARSSPFETMTTLAARHNFSLQLHPETVFALDLDPTTTTNYFVSVLFSTPTTSGPPWVTRCGRGGWLAAWNLVLHVPTGARVHDWWVLTDDALFVRAMMMMVCKKSDQRPPPGMGKNCRLFI